MLPIVGLILLYSGCDQTSTGLIELEGEKIKYYENVDNSELQFTDQSLLIGAEAMKIAIQKPEFLVEVYKSLKFYDKQAHEYDMNRFAAVSIAELESDDALHRRNENFSKLTASKSSKIFKNSLSEAIMSLPQNGLDSEDIHKFYIEDLVNLYMPNFELWDGKEIPTIAWHTLDEEEEEAPGFEPVIDPITSNVIDWKVVKTNETYGKV